MKILFLTPQAPYPPNSGGVIKTLKMIEHLSLKHELVVGFFDKNSSDTKATQEYFNTHSIGHFSIELNKKRNALNFFKSLIQRLPLSVYRNKNLDFQKMVNKHAKQCDLIIIDHFLMFQYIPKFYTKKKIYHSHNAEFLMWQRYSENELNVLKKWLLSFEANRIKKYEKRIIENVNSVLAAPNDIQILKTLSSANFYETLHLGDESLLSRPPISFDETNRDILFIGTLTWEANIDGLVWFLENSWPQIKKLEKKIKLKIVGKIANEQLFKKWQSDESIEFLGFVENINELYDRSRVFIAPLRFGSGIKVKVVNAIYRGIPTVTTNVGVEGMNLIKNTDIAIEDNPQQFALRIIEILNDKAIWNKLSLNSRAYATRELAWNTVLKKIDEVIELD